MLQPQRGDLHLSRSQTFLDNHEERKSAQQSKKSAEQPGNMDVFTVLRALRCFVVNSFVQALFASSLVRCFNALSLPKLWRETLLPGFQPTQAGGRPCDGRS
jgi:hypothetical protein